MTVDISWTSDVFMLYMQYQTSDMSGRLHLSPLTREPQFWPCVERHRWPANITALSPLYQASQGHHKAITALLKELTGL